MEVTQIYIYADNAATTKTSQAAIKAMNECMEDFYGNPSSLHSVGQRAAEKLLQARMDVAECSILVEIICFFPFFAPNVAAEMIAWLSASLPPDVK